MSCGNHIYCCFQPYYWKNIKKIPSPYNSETATSVQVEMSKIGYTSKNSFQQLHCIKISNPNNETKINIKYKYNFNPTALYFNLPGCLKPTTLYKNRTIVPIPSDSIERIYL